MWCSIAYCHNFTRYRNESEKDVLIGKQKEQKPTHKKPSMNIDHAKGNKGTKKVVRTKKKHEPPNFRSQLVIQILQRTTGR